MKITPMEVTLIDSMGSDLNVVNAARVSFHKESVELDGQDEKLINYLAKHGHWTPFGHVFLSFRVKAPIFVARQLVKHQVGLCWNEVSRRYVSDEPEFWFPTQLRGKPVNAKQGSTGEIDAYSNSEWIRCMREQTESTLSLYEGLIEDGIAPEQARMVLPQNTHTEWIWSGSLAAFSRVCKLRLDPHAQAETNELAQKIKELVPSSMKVSWNALLGNEGK